MEQIYRIKRDSITELLKHIDKFKDKIDLFVEDHDNYNYGITIEKIEEDNKIKWIADLLVIKDED